jgi:hypothetical protein
MALGSSAVAAKAPPMAVAFAPCSKIENPAAKAVLLAARHNTWITAESLVKERKVTSSI